jgi:Uncharacterized conserved small protein containing a coiled-coil domain
MKYAVSAYGNAAAIRPETLLESRLKVTISEQEQAEIRLEFARLKQDHADFDAAINAMIASGCDPLQIQRMKKKKLALKDRLQQLEDRLIPDIIA